jgi:hypothetical protein
MSYELYSNHLVLPCSNETKLCLSITANSGRVVTRRKIDTVIGVEHPGIELGIDQYGRRWIAHHHYKNSKPAIECEDIYADGNKIRYVTNPTYYNQSEILERALYYWWNVGEYKLINQNCQHFVNLIANGVHRSESMEEVSDMLAIGSVLTIFGGLLTGNKNLVGLGIGLGCVGGATKFLSKQPPSNELGTSYTPTYY